MNPDEVQKLSDRDLLIKTYGKVEWIVGILGNGGGLLEVTRVLQVNQKSFVTRKELTLTVGIISVIFAGIGAVLYFL